MNNVDYLLLGIINDQVNEPINWACLSSADGGHTVQDDINGDDDDEQQSFHEGRGGEQYLLWMLADMCSTQQKYLKT